MNERLKRSAEALWQDQKDMLTVLPIFGVRDFIASLRESPQPYDLATVHSLEPNILIEPGPRRADIYSTAA